MEYSKGDLVDKLTILQIKKSHGLDSVELELRQIETEAMSFLNKISKLYTALYEANLKVWNLEDAIGQTNDLKTIGTINLKIGKYNGKRIAIKNKINSCLNSGFQEIKSKNHRSYETVNKKININE